ncbi:MAG TPA: VWA domain-containing protein [Vicinamibacteria bacterium]
MTGAALALALAGAAAAQEPPTFGVEVEAVRLDVVVTRRGRPVRDLDPANFEVLDNGVPQSVALVPRQEAPANVLLVLDTSTSVVGTRLARLKEAAATFVQGLAEDDRAGLLVFSHRVRLLAPPGSPPLQVASALGGIEAGGATALVDAAYVAMSLMDTGKGRPVVVLFTDGEDEMSWLSWSGMRRSARQSEAAFYAIVPEPGPRWDETLGGLVEDTGGRWWKAGDDSLRDAFLQVLEAVRSRYVLSYQPQGVAEGGWHEVEVRIKGKAGEARTRRGYVRRRP